MTRQDLKIRLIAASSLLLVLWFVWSLVGPLWSWSQRPPLLLRVLPVDYTVPFDNYKEHLGIFWLLNHLKVVPPPGADRWSPERDYLGYSPLDRDNPRRISGRRPLSADLIYIADTYGVYRDDLKGIATRQAHMDYNPLVFGGLSLQDAQALEGYAAGGGHLIVEFNSLCDPTGDKPRAIMERLLGVRWTGWVGRLFIDPHDKANVPWWLPRIFDKQYPGQELPHQPMLIFVNRAGELVWVARSSVDQLAPRVEMTPRGKKDFHDLTEDTRYFYWFALVEARPGTETYAELVLPPGIAQEPGLVRRKIPTRTPLFTELTGAPSRRIYLAADLADVDFELGEFGRAGAIEARADSVFTAAQVSSSPIFWRFYAPVIRRVLWDLDRQLNAAP